MGNNICNYAYFHVSFLWHTFNETYAIVMFSNNLECFGFLNKREDNSTRFYLYEFLLKIINMRSDTFTHDFPKNI